ncbi:hypothetical protein [Acidovorax soli]|uniref:hypothetical protein n=1 Tax=Acidovorax soli TaxID=592050 RepID=UPI0032B171B9
MESSNLKITLLEPEDLVKLADHIVKAQPDVLLLDYRLDEDAGSRDGAAAFRAAPLAQQIRDRLGDGPASDFPIVLISSEHKIQTLFRPEKTAHDLFDWKLIKDDVANPRSSRANLILLGLARGYQVLKGLQNHFDSPALFGLSIEQAYLTDYQELKESLRESEYPHIAARYILNFVIRRSGLLLDWHNLLARLGIAAPDADSPALNALHTWLTPTRYAGVFTECRELWWSSMVEEKFEDILNDPVDRLTAAQRANKLSDALEQTYLPATDRWSKTTEFHPIFACAICASATPLKHSLSCLDGRLPKFVDRHRVCFRCIQTDKLEEFNAQSSSEVKLILDETEQRIALRIRSGQLIPAT